MLPICSVLFAAALASTAVRGTPGPYSLPWQLRPAQPVNVVRIDTSTARFSAVPGEPASTAVASLLLASYKVTPRLSPLVRLGVVHLSQGNGDSGTALANPIVGATYGFPLTDHLRFAAFLGVSVPVGAGGGNTPNPRSTAAVRAGVLTRSGMDNAMFAVNDLTVFPGLDLAYVRGGFTVQAEATILQLTRVRGEAVQPDAARTNLTSGVHVGYFLARWASVGTEMRYQRWLSTPSMLAANPKLRDTLTVAVGPRFHAKVSAHLTLRPGLSYATGLDDPMRAQKFHVVQLDVPVLF